MIESNQPDLLIAALQSRDWADYSSARQALVALGGEAAEALRPIAADEANPLNATAMGCLPILSRKQPIVLPGGWPNSYALAV
jgi:hypothetical protein